MSPVAVDTALDLMASLVLEEGLRWGERATPDQWEGARAILDPASSVPYHFLTRARGYSKTTDLAGMAIAAILTQLSAGSRLYGLASDRDQGRLLLESLQGFVLRTPFLLGGFDVQNFKATALRSGSTLEILAADAPGAFGLRPAFLIVDELAQHADTPEPKKLWEATTSAMAKVPGARLVVLTSAGAPEHWSHKVLEHAYEDSLWRVHEIPGPPPWINPARLAEQRRRLPESSYLRLFENKWVTGEDRLANIEDIRACATLDGPQKHDSQYGYILTLDLGIKHDRTVAAICHREPFKTYEDGSSKDGGKVFLDRMQVWAGSRQSPVQLQGVEDWIVEACGQYRCGVVFDPFQAVGLAQRLSAQGIRCEQFNFSSSSVGKLASTLHLLIRNRALAIPENDEALIDELANVQLREMSPGVFRMDHAAGRHDDRAIALGMAAVHLLQQFDEPEYYVPLWIDGRPIRRRNPNHPNFDPYAEEPLVLKFRGHPR